MSATINTLAHLRAHTHSHTHAQSHTRTVTHAHSKSIKYVCCCLFVWHFLPSAAIYFKFKAKTTTTEQQQKRNNIKEPVRSNVPCGPWRQQRLQVIVNMARGSTEVDCLCLLRRTGSARTVNLLLNRFRVAKPL